MRTRTIQVSSFLLGFIVSGSAYSHENFNNIPADTYFAMAVTENSHNHYGENLLYLVPEQKVTNIFKNKLL